MTGINSALGSITAACPGDRQAERDRGLSMLSLSPPPTPGVSPTPAGIREGRERSCQRERQARKQGAKDILIRGENFKRRGDDANWDEKRGGKFVKGGEEKVNKREIKREEREDIRGEQVVGGRDLKGGKGNETRGKITAGLSSGELEQMRNFFPR